VEPLVAELKHQYHSTLAMLQSTIEACPKELWSREYAGVPLWREAYHALFWMHSFLGLRDKRFAHQPFGVDIDPWVIRPAKDSCSRAEAVRYAAQTGAYIDEVFEAMTLDELDAADAYDETGFRSVYHRLMYGLRHVQHHVGKLTAYLNLEGVQLSHWKG
jgi:hypothetical protein